MVLQRSLLSVYCKKRQILLPNVVAILLICAFILLRNASGITKRVGYITKRGSYYKMPSVIRQKVYHETGLSRKQRTPDFPKNEHFLPSNTHTRG